MGGYYGFRLASAGQPVRYLARGETLRQLRKRGLRVTSGGKTLDVAVAADDDPAALRPCDTILIAVKNPDLEAALAAARAGLGEAAFAVTLQNGILAPGQAQQQLGLGRVVAGIAYLGCARIAPAEILHTGLGRLTFGEPGGGTSERCAALVAEFEACGVPARASARIEEDLWRKLAWNAAFNGTTALARSSPAALLADADSRALCLDLVREVGAAARARGVELPEGLPEEIARMSEPLTDLRTSMLQDIEAGRPTELDSLYRATLDILHAAGLPAGAHRAVAGLLAAAERGFKGGPDPGSP